MFKKRSKELWVPGVVCMECDNTFCAQDSAICPTCGEAYNLQSASLKLQVAEYVWPIRLFKRAAVEVVSYRLHSDALENQEIFSGAGASPQEPVTQNQDEEMQQRDEEEGDIQTVEQVSDETLFAYASRFVALQERLGWSKKQMIDVLGLQDITGPSELWTMRALSNRDYALRFFRLEFLLLHPHMQAFVDSWAVVDQMEYLERPHEWLGGQSIKEAIKTEARFSILTDTLSQSGIFESAPCVPLRKMLPFNPTDIPMRKLLSVLPPLTGKLVKERVSDALGISAETLAADVFGYSQGIREKFLYHVLRASEDELTAGCAPLARFLLLLEFQSMHRFVVDKSDTEILRFLAAPQRSLCAQISVRTSLKSGKLFSSLVEQIDRLFLSQDEERAYAEMLPVDKDVVRAVLSRYGYVRKVREFSHMVGIGYGTINNWMGERTIKSYRFRTFQRVADYLAKYCPDEIGMCDPEAQKLSAFLSIPQDVFDIPLSALFKSRSGYEILRTIMPPVGAME